MATAAVSRTKHPERARQRDRLFFSGIALLVLSAVLVGFARTYFLAGVFWANLANAMVHVRGALFTLWIALLVTQVALVASHRTGWHMRLGIAGMFLAPLMVITGFATLIAANKEKIRPSVCPSNNYRTGHSPPLPLRLSYFMGFSCPA